MQGKLEKALDLPQQKVRVPCPTPVRDITTHPQKLKRII